MLHAAVRTTYQRLVPLRVRERIAAARQRARHIATRRHTKYQRSLMRLADFRNKHHGETCVIIGNGPSMAGFDLQQLSELKTFCLNRGYLMWNEQNLTPDYLVVVNQLVIEQFAQELQAVNAVKFTPWLHRAYFAPDNDLIFFEERWEETFIPDARHGLASLATVTNTTLQLAWHMGFETVILLGIDHHFSAAERGRPHQMVVQDRADADHFRPDYFAPGTRWHLPDLEMSERGYKLARHVFESAGRRIINATPGTRLDVFEKAPLSDLLAAERIRSI